jgi:hypothetical protein
MSTRPALARKVEKIGAKILYDKAIGYNGYLPKNSSPNIEDDQHSQRMMCIVSDRKSKCNLFKNTVKNKNIPIVSLYGGMSKDYDQKKYQEGIREKEYTYNYLIPYTSQKGDFEPIFCNLKFKTTWYDRKKWTDPDEMNSWIYCDASREKLKETIDFMKGESGTIEQFKKDYKIK